MKLPAPCSAVLCRAGSHEASPAVSVPSGARRRPLIINLAEKIDGRCLCCPLYMNAACCPLAAAPRAARSNSSCLPDRTCCWRCEVASSGANPGSGAGSGGHSQPDPHCGKDAFRVCRRVMGVWSVLTPGTKQDLLSSMTLGHTRRSHQEVTAFMSGSGRAGRG